MQCAPLTMVLTDRMDASKCLLGLVPGGEKPLSPLGLGNLGDRGVDWLLFPCPFSVLRRKSCCQYSGNTCKRLAKTGAATPIPKLEKGKSWKEKLH